MFKKELEALCVRLGMEQLVSDKEESSGPSTRFFRLPNGVGLIDLRKVVAVIVQDGDVDIRIEGRSYKIKQGAAAAQFARDVSDAVEAFATGGHGGEDA